MPVDRNRSRLVWSVLTYHPRTYTHSASPVTQQPVCASRTILFVQLVEPLLAGESPNTIHDQNIEIYIIRYICCSFSLPFSFLFFLLSTWKIWIFVNSNEKRGKSAIHKLWHGYLTLRSIALHRETGEVGEKISTAVPIFKYSSSYLSNWSASSDRG